MNDRSLNKSNQANRPADIQHISQQQEASGDRLPLESQPEQKVSNITSAIFAAQRKKYYQLLQLNLDLEAQVKEKTAQLQRFLDYEALLKRISDDVRDTLDEKQLLQTVVWELAVGLNIHGCNLGLYDLERQISTIAYEYNVSIDMSQGQVVQMQDFSEGYEQLLQRQSFQFCELIPSWRTPATILVCPIFDEREIVGDLWLFKQAEFSFDELELRLVEQVANYCAVAIRQARLNRAAQTKIQELEALHCLKDDFLATVSHELRTPLANIKMAIEMLYLTWQRQPEIALNTIASSVGERSRIERYLQILNRECERERHLIDNLLDVKQSQQDRCSVLTAIRLDEWLPQTIAPFQERSRQYNQSLSWEISPSLPRLICEPTVLERIMAELLNNACKYTPAGEIILVKVEHKPKTVTDSNIVQISITNTGVEISKHQQSQIFEKFYRIQAHDFWNQGGTGLGLTIVKRLVARLGGEISVASAMRQTCFTIELPLN